MAAKPRMPENAPTPVREPFIHHDFLAPASSIRQPELAPVAARRARPDLPWGGGRKAQQHDDEEEERVRIG